MIIEKWQIDRRYWYVRVVRFGFHTAPFLAVVDDFGTLVEVNHG